MVYKNEIADYNGACAWNVQEESYSAVESIEEIPAHIEHLIIERVALNTALSERVRFILPVLVDLSIEGD